MLNLWSAAAFARNDFTNARIWLLELRMFSAIRREFASSFACARLSNNCGAHFHPGKMVLQMVRNHAQQFLLVLRQPFQVVPRGLEHQMGSHPRNQFKFVERLGDVIHPAAFQRANNQILVVRRGKKNDRDVRPGGVFLDLPAQSKPSMPGISRSSRIRSGRRTARRLSACAPLVAGRISKPSLPSMVPSTWMIGLLIVHHQQTVGRGRFCKWITHVVCWRGRGRCSIS